MSHVAWLAVAVAGVLSLGGVACSHHHHRDDQVVVDQGPSPATEIFYDEAGRPINDPVVLERIRYYDAEPERIEVRDGAYYFRGELVHDRAEIRALELTRLHERNREIKNKRAAYDRLEKQKREELDRAEKQKREELDREEKTRREEADRKEKQSAEQRGVQSPQ